MFQPQVKAGLSWLPPTLMVIPFLVLPSSGLDSAPPWPSLPGASAAEVSREGQAAVGCHLRPKGVACPQDAAPGHVTFQATPYQSGGEQQGTPPGDTWDQGLGLAA